MGLFWLFLFRLSSNRIHGISISKRTLLLKTEYPWRRSPENYYYVCGRVGTPAKNFPKERVFWPILSIPSKPYSPYSVHSAIGSRMNGIIFRSFRKRNSSQKNTNTVYSEHSYSGIVPKERAPSNYTVIQSLSYFADG